MSPTAYDEWLGRTTQPRTERAARRTALRAHSAHRARAVRAAVLLLGVLAAAIGFAGPANATWSVVGTDPATGQVGAAVASCVDTHDLTTTMALVPKVGGAVSVGQAAGNTPALLAAALRGGGTPEQVTAAMRAANVDAGFALRQYGVAVIGAGARSSTGADTASTTGARVSADGTATVQGNVLASPAVLDGATRAFDTTTGPLATRLLAALNAGGVAGGDRSCGGTTRSAAVVVLGPNSALFVPAATDPQSGTSDLLDANLTPAQLADRAAAQSVRPAPRGPHAPVVYLSAVTGPGHDALAVIDTRYAGIVAESSKKAPVASDEIVDPAYSQGLTIAALILFCVIGLIVAALIIAGLRRAERRAAEQDDPDGTDVAKPYRGEVAHLFDVDLTAARRRKRLAEQEVAATERKRESVWSSTSW